MVVTGTSWRTTECHHQFEQLMACNSCAFFTQTALDRWGSYLLSKGIPLYSGFSGCQPRPPTFGTPQLAPPCGQAKREGRSQSLGFVLAMLRKKDSRQDKAYSRIDMRESTHAHEHLTSVKAYTRIPTRTGQGWGSLDAK